jgi:putative restriction endonuclease
MQVDPDLAVRLAAFSWLAEKTTAFGDVLPRSVLQQGFQFENARIPLVSPQGIHKPRILDLPLSITTTLEGPYDDASGPDGFLRYRYRGIDPQHPDNIGLRRVMEQKRPLVYFKGVVPGKYLAVWPVYIVTDHPHDLSFSVAVDDAASVAVETQEMRVVAEGSDSRRAYITATVRLRLHQRLFRERVLEAYRSQCALCRLRHRELLDAAHILPDTAPRGEPVITNGLALCKLHHAAFDSFILGVSPDYLIHIRHDVLEEKDGPMLQHGLKELEGAKLVLPTARVHWPNREALAWRFEQFKSAV